MLLGQTELNWLTVVVVVPLLMPLLEVAVDVAVSVALTANSLLSN